MIAISLTMMAQDKLTPQAKLNIACQKAKIKQLAARSMKTTDTQEPTIANLVVKVADGQATKAAEQMKAVGADINARLGQQMMISIPLDSMQALQHCDGVLRIDKGHKGHKKSDVTRRETGVIQLQDEALPPGSTAYTGKGVTICIVDAGFDFQHQAFKDDEGRSRIKCVYLMGDKNGNPFSYNDSEVGEIVFPGSVYDTPELIATLTTDDSTEYHGSHTAAIAAGSISPQGFGGMAPDADLVLIPLQELKGAEFENIAPEAYIELAMAFAIAYAGKSGQPMVLSCSANSHSGPHDGTSSVTEAIETVSDYLIPVFSAGNEGGYPIHLYQKFTAATPSVKTLLIAIMEDDSGEYEYLAVPYVNGYTRTGDEVSIQLTLKSINQFTGRLTTVWSSEKCTAKTGGEDRIFMVSSEDDETLAKYFEGNVAVAAMDNGNGKLCVGAIAEGGMRQLYLFELIISGSEGTEIDLWDEMAGFGGRNFLGLSGYVDGDSNMSAGDWTTTEKVISVGAYCANVKERSYDGSITDTSKPKGEDDTYVLNNIAWFSSHGTSTNNVSQPTICAPGVNIVSAVNHFALEEAPVVDDMQWQGSPYSAESGTSMACPAVSGIIALWLQANPTMTLDDVKDVLRNTSRTDSYTDQNTTGLWGYGKIDAARGISYITQTDAVSTVQAKGSEDGILYDLQGRSIDRNPAAGIYIYKGKKVVRVKK